MSGKIVVFRSYGGVEIRQREDGFFNANDAIAASNVVTGLAKRLDNYMASELTKEFLEALERRIGINPVDIRRGKYGGTWLHPAAFVHLSTQTDPELNVSVMMWITDKLVDNRIESKELFVSLSKSICRHHIRKTGVRAAPDIYAAEAIMIKEACEVEDWAYAGESKLELRVKLEKALATAHDKMMDNPQRRALVNNIVDMHNTYGI